MRRPFVCGNWKMHKTVSEALELVDGLLERLDRFGEVEVGIAPPFTALHAVRTRIGEAPLRVTAQNAHFEAQGAFTGEISMSMLREVGCDYVLLGHSERRQLFGETDEGVARKVGAALDSGLSVILALGETLDQREAGDTLAVVERQLDAGLKGLSAAALERVVVAYEPVWAIGTGRTATPEQAQEVHAALRSGVSKAFGAEAAGGVRIQYGGSVKPGNAADLFAQPDIDGGLIGGASLKVDDFSAVCETAGAR
ncbi:MAG: triose-phosphate isomerase [Myxococcota bacterium]